MEKKWKNGCPQRRPKSANSLSDLETLVLAAASAVTLYTAPRLRRMLAPLMPRIAPEGDDISHGQRHPRAVSQATIYRALGPKTSGRLGKRNRQLPGAVAVHAVQIRLKISRERDGRMRAGVGSTAAENKPEYVLVLVLVERYSGFSMLKRITGVEYEEIKTSEVDNAEVDNAEVDNAEVGDKDVSGEEVDNTEVRIRIAKVDHEEVMDAVRIFSERMAIRVDEVSFVSRRVRKSPPVDTVFGMGLEDLKAAMIGVGMPCRTGVTDVPANAGITGSGSDEVANVPASSSPDELGNDGADSQDGKFNKEEGGEESQIATTKKSDTMTLAEGQHAAGSEIGNGGTRRGGSDGGCVSASWWAGRKITLDKPIAIAKSSIPLLVDREFFGYSGFRKEMARLVNFYNLGVGTNYAEPFETLTDLIREQRPDLANSTTFIRDIKRRLRQQ